MAAPSGFAQRARVLGCVGAAAVTVACGSQEVRSQADAVESLVCPELGGSVDPLEASFSDDPRADARIRGIVSAARGLNEVSIEMERRAVEACREMRKDLGAPAVAPTAPLDVQCEPVRSLIARLATEGVQVRIAIAPPRCEPDATRKARCDAVAAGGGAAEAAAICEAESAVYARCSLPSISFAGSKNVDAVTKLGLTLEKNLPSLLYAEMALGKRLVQHAATLVEASTRLTHEVKDAGPRGLACVGLAARVTAVSAERLTSFLAASGRLVLALDPEVRS